MDQPAIEKADRLTSVEANKPASLPISDLNLTDAQAIEIKGGPICHGTTVLAWARVDGVSASNHNETVAEDETETSEALADLPVVDAEQVKGGLTSGSPSGTGKVLTAALLGKSD